MKPPATTSTKNLYPLIFLLVLGAMDARAQRTVIIEPGFGTINDGIMGDTTAAGERVDSNTVYVLRGGLTFDDRYYLNGSIISGNYHLQIVLEDGSDEPAVLQVLSDETGASAGTFIDAQGDVTLRGLYMLGLDDLDAPRSQHVIINGDTRTLIVDDCFIDYNRFIAFRFNGLDGSLRLTNSHLRNVLTTNNPGNGKIVDGRGTNLQSVYVENNTFEGVSAEFIRLSKGILQDLFFNHNTIYTMHGFVRDDFRENANKVVDARIANNLFINMGWVGDTLNTANAPSNHHVGIFSFDSLSTVPGLTEEDRDVLISHNNFFWEPELETFLNSNFPVTCAPPCGTGTVKQYPIFNPRAQEFVNAGLVRFDNAIEEDPGFMHTAGASRFVDWAKGYWTDPASVSATMVYYDPDGTQEVTDWPVQDNFAYSTSSVSYTAGTGGFPLGDLNWFPDRMAAWVAAGGGSGVIVAQEDDFELPARLALKGNYPNPFNPSTTVRFDLPSTADVRIEVFDLLGRLLFDTPSQSLAAGTDHSIKVDAGTLPSGVYLYRVVAETITGVQTQIGRMLLVK